MNETAMPSAKMLVVVNKDKGLIILSNDFAMVLDLRILSADIPSS